MVSCAPCWCLLVGLLFSSCKAGVSSPLTEVLWPRQWFLAAPVPAQYSWVWVGQPEKDRCMAWGCRDVFLERNLHLHLVQRVPHCMPKCVCLVFAALSLLPRTGSGTCSVALPVKCQRKQFNSYTDLLQLKKSGKHSLPSKLAFVRRAGWRVEKSKITDMERSIEEL